MPTELTSEQIIEQVETKIGYRFRDSSGLLVALTHPSAVADPSISDPQHKHYERLEFLGDRVLGLVAAEQLLEHYPNADEGGLANRLNYLVSRKACAAIAADLELGQYLILGVSEKQSGGQRKAAILANACEALIAAIYLDGGLEAVRAFFNRFWADRLTGLDKAPRDAKTVLQEWAQGRGLPVPDYNVTAKQGPDHRPKFTVEVVVKDFPSAEGRGASKKDAEHEAATAFLVREAVWKKEKAADGR